MDKRIHDAFYNEELTKVIEDIPVKTGDPESVTITGINIMAIDPELKLPYCGTASIYYVPRNLAVFENYDLIRAITMMTMIILPKGSRQACVRNCVSHKSPDMGCSMTMQKVC